MSRPEMAVGAVPIAAARRFPLIHVLLLATTTLTTAMASSLFQGFYAIDDFTYGQPVTSVPEIDTTNLVWWWEKTLHSPRTPGC